MLFAELAQRVQRAFPVFARLMREHGGHIDQFAGCVHHRHLHPGANARVQAHHHPWASRCRQQQVAQIVSKYLDGDFFSVFPEPREQITLQRQTELDAPGPRHALAYQIVCRPRLVAPAQVQRNFPFRKRHHWPFGQRCTRGQCRLGQQQLDVQNLQRPAPEHGQRPVRGHAAHGLVVIKIVAKLGVVSMVFILAIDQFGRQQPFGPQPAAQPLHQGGVFRPAFAQNIAHTVQHGLDGGEVVTQFAFFSFHAGCSLDSRRQCRVRKQPVSQGFKSGFAGHLPFGAAFLFERQVNVFQILFAGSLGNCLLQRGRQLALLTDAVEHCLLALGQLTQVAQPLLQLAQLNVVQPTGGFLAVTGNERHRGTIVKQVYSGVDLVLLNLQFPGNLSNDGRHIKNSKTNSI